MSKKANKKIKIFFIGATAYPLIEILWRGRTHWSMAIAGGTCFVIICSLSNRMKKCVMWKKCFAGAGAITGVEFVSGVVVNKQLGLNVWDYSSMPLNLMGQICLPYCALWFLLCIPAFWLGDYIRERENF